MSRNKKGKHPAGVPKIFKEGVQPEALGEEQDGHVVVVTTMGLAMLVAGLRAIALDSPEVEPLLETLEDALREGAEERKLDGYGYPEQSLEERAASPGHP